MPTLYCYADAVAVAVAVADADADADAEYCVQHYSLICLLRFSVVYNKPE
jgi:hypothetical protein